MPLRFRNAQRLAWIDLIRAGEHWPVGLEDFIVLIRIAIHGFRNGAQGIAGFHRVVRFPPR